VVNLRVRFEFSKNGAARFLSHLDMARTFERAVRRAGLPVAYTRGFNPHPKISFGPALAVGVAGEREYVDMEFEVEVDVLGTVEKLQHQMPEGIKMRTALEVPERSGSINAAIDRAEYLVCCPASAALSPGELKEAVEELLSRERIIIQKRTDKGTKSKDIRSGIYLLEGEVENERVIFKMLLQLSPSGSVTPGDVLKAFYELAGIPVDISSPTIRRTGLFACQEGKLKTPLEILAKS